MQVNDLVMFSPDCEHIGYYYSPELHDAVGIIRAVYLSDDEPSLYDVEFQVNYRLKDKFVIFTLMRHEMEYAPIDLLTKLSELSN